MGLWRTTEHKNRAVTREPHVQNKGLSSIFMKCKSDLSGFPSTFLAPSFPTQLRDTPDGDARQMPLDFTRVGSQLPQSRKWHFLGRSEEHTSELQSRLHLVCRLLLEKKKKQTH